MAYGEAPILIKKIKKVSGGGHHGGAWKVAYADFVTAMMAFFLLMWLINTTSPEQKKGIADYFAPASVSPTTSGAGGILGGTSLGDEGAKSDGATRPADNNPPASADVSKTKPAVAASAGARRTSSRARPRACARRCRPCPSWPSFPSSSWSTRRRRACASS